jgi:hypothetical protein
MATFSACGLDHAGLAGCSLESAAFLGSSLAVPSQALVLMLAP